MQNDETDEDKAARMQLAELCEELGREVGKRKPADVDFVLLMYRARPAGNSLLAWWSNIIDREQWKAVVRHFLAADDGRPRSQWEGGGGSNASGIAGQSTHDNLFQVAIENGRTFLRGWGTLVGYAGGGGDGRGTGGGGGGGGNAEYKCKRPYFEHPYFVPHPDDPNRRVCGVCRKLIDD